MLYFRCLHHRGRVCIRPARTESFSDDCVEEELYIVTPGDRLLNQISLKTTLYEVFVRRVFTARNDILHSCSALNQPQG